MTGEDKSSDDELLAEMEQFNDSGFEAADLARIVKADQGAWSESVTVEELMRLISEWLAESDERPTQE
jgi:hypothetical protein